MKIYQNVDEYISSFPAETQKVLIQLRTTIRSVAPQAQEAISYGMPAYKLYGRPLVYFAAFKNHIGFYPTPSGVASFVRELSKYKQGKGSVQFPLSDQIPLGLIKKIIKARISENKEKS